MPRRRPVIRRRSPHVPRGLTPPARPAPARDRDDDRGSAHRLAAAPGVNAGPTPAKRPGEWELTLCGDLTDRQGELMGELVELPRGSRGTVWFDSPGGSVYTGLAMASVMRLRGLRATGVVAGECSSAAILPLAACQRRLVTRHATLLFHPVRWHSEEDVKREEAVEWARHFEAMEKDIDDLLAQLLPMDRQELEKWTRPGKFVSGEELAAVGLAELVTLFDGDVWQQAGRGARR